MQSRSSPAALLALGLAVPALMAPGEVVCTVCEEVEIWHDVVAPGEKVVRAVELEPGSYVVEVDSVAVALSVDGATAVCETDDETRACALELSDTVTVDFVLEIVANGGFCPTCEVATTLVLYRES